MITVANAIGLWLLLTEALIYMVLIVEWWDDDHQAHFSVRLARP